MVIIFDTETSDKVDGEIIEAAYACMPTVIDLAGNAEDTIPPLTGWESVHSKFNGRYKPSKPMTCGSIAVHHILPSELEGCEPSATFQLPADVRYIIGHSVDFDWKAAGSPDVKRICTHAMAQHVFPLATGYSLVALIYHTNGATQETRELVRNAHSALHDVRLCLDLLMSILKAKPEIRSWSALHAFSEDCRIPRTCPMKKYEGVLLEDLDEGFITWCLNQDWLDPYYRIGLERVMANRYPAFDGDDEEEAAGIDDEEDDLPF